MKKLTDRHFFGDYNFKTRSVLKRFYGYFWIAGIAQGLTLPFLPIFLNQVGLSVIEIGWIFAIQSLAVILLEIPTGLYADVLSRKTSTLLAMLALFSMCVVFLLAGTLPIEHGARFGLCSLAAVLFGTGTAFRDGAVTSWMVDELLPTTKEPITFTRIFAKMRIILNLTMFLGSLAIFRLDNLQNNQGVNTQILTMLPMACSYALVYLWVLFGMPEHLEWQQKDHNRSKSHAVFKEAFSLIWSRPALLSLFAVSAFSMTLLETINAYYPIFFQELTRAFSSDYSTGLLHRLGWLSVPTVVGFMAIGRLAGNFLVIYGKKEHIGRLWFWGILSHVLPLFALVAFVRFVNPQIITPQIFLLFALALFSLERMGEGTVKPLTEASFQNYLPPQIRATCLSIDSLLGNLGCVVAMGLLPTLTQSSIPMTWALLGVFVLVSYSFYYFMQSRKKTCVLVDPTSSGALLAPTLKAQGYECFYIQSNSWINPYHLSSQKLEDFAGYMIHDSKDFERTKAWVEKHSPDFITIGTDTGVRVMDQLNKVLNLPGNRPETTHLRRDKYHMAEAVRMAGLNAPLQLRSGDLQTILAWVSSVCGWPIVVKPLGGGGTGGVKACSDSPSLASTLKELIGGKDCYGTPIEEVLVQELLKGTEYIVDTVSLAGRHHVTDIWRYNKIKVDGAFFVYETKELLPYQGSIQDSLIDYTLKALDAVEHRYGAAHNEIMMTERGPVLVEINPRMGGLKAPIINKECLGRSQLEATVDIFTNPKRFYSYCDQPYQIQKHGLVVYLVVEKAGYFLNFSELQNIRALPSFFELRVLSKPGELLGVSKDLFTTPAVVELVSESKEQLAYDYQQIRKMEKSGDLYINRWSANIHNRIL